MFLKHFILIVKNASNEMLFVHILNITNLALNHNSVTTDNLSKCENLFFLKSSSVWLALEKTLKFTRSLKCTLLAFAAILCSVHAHSNHTFNLICFFIVSIIYLVIIDGLPKLLKTICVNSILERKRIRLCGKLN